MNKNNLVVIEIEGYKVFINSTKHSNKRFKERLKKRNITMWEVTGNVVLLGEKLIQHAKNEDEFAILDTDHNISVICGSYMSGNKIIVNIMTLIDKSNIYVKSGTKIESL